MSRRLMQTEKLDRAEPPFKTSSLQQQGVIRLRFPGKKTMKSPRSFTKASTWTGRGLSA